jgi:hypothetical protein
MKSIQQMLTSRWTRLLAVLFIAVWCARVDAAYWNRNRTQTHRQGADLDGDGIPNIVDPDIDNDGIPNSLDRNIDGGIARSGPNEGKYIGDREDNDSPSEDDIDADGLSDDSLGEKDTDGDGKLNDEATEDDIDGDGRSDDNLAERDIDGDGRNDDSDMEDDIDGDGRDDDDSQELDIDGDSKSDLTDDDIDGDGRSNDDVADTDIDGDGRLNDDSAETDDDGDELADVRDDDDNNDSVKDIDDPHHHPESGEQEIQAELAAQPAAPQDSSVKITLQHYGTGSAKFAVDARDLAVGNYELLVGGVVRGTVVVVQESNKTQGELVFKSAESGSGTLLLDFPVAEQSIELRQAGTVYFSGIAPALPPIGSGEDGANSVTLTRGAGVSNLAEVEVQFHFGSGSPTQLEINLQKVPAGDYAVVIGNVPRGMLVVLATAGGNEGQLNFEVGGSGDNLPLDFPSAGQAIEIVQGSTVYFFGQLPAAAAAP